MLLCIVQYCFFVETRNRVVESNVQLEPSSRENIGLLEPSLYAARQEMEDDLRQLRQWTVEANQYKMAIKSEQREIALKVCYF